MTRRGPLRFSSSRNANGSAHEYPNRNPGDLKFKDLEKGSPDCKLISTKEPQIESTNKRMRIFLIAIIFIIYYRLRMLNSLYRQIILFSLLILSL